MTRLLLIFAISVMLSNALTAQALQVSTVRDLFFRMQQEKNGPLTLYFRLKGLDLSKDAVMLAYRGAASAASAGSVNGVHKKLQYFSGGKTELEEAVRKQPDNIEVLFLRLVTQMNAPGFLGYNSNIESDKKIIIRQLAEIPVNDPNSYLYIRIMEYLLSAESLNKQEMTEVARVRQKFKSK